MAALDPDASPARPAVDVLALERIARDLLDALGEDPGRDGLKDTPARWARMWRDFIEYDPGSTGTTFQSVEADQMVVVSGIRTWSFCEHHLLPFWCDVSVGYLAAGRVLGLSKFARVVHAFAHRLQVQERLTQQVADEVARLTGSLDVAVTARGEHTCMTMRGVKTSATMTSSVMRGAFRDDPASRAEFMRLAVL